MSILGPSGSDIPGNSWPPEEILVNERCDCGDGAQIGADEPCHGRHTKSTKLGGADNFQCYWKSGDCPETGWPVYSLHDPFTPCPDTNSCQRCHGHKWKNAAKASELGLERVRERPRITIMHLLFFLFFFAAGFALGFALQALLGIGPYHAT